MFKAGDKVSRRTGTYLGMKTGDIDIVREWFNEAMFTLLRHEGYHNPRCFELVKSKKRKKYV